MSFTSHSLPQPLFTKATLYHYRFDPTQQLIFNASDGWLKKLMQWNSLSLCKTKSMQQNLLSNLEKKLEEFIGGAKALCEHHKFPDNLTINMDETPIFFDMHKDVIIIPF